MSEERRRTIVRVGALGLHWLGLTIGLGAMVIRSDQSLNDLISPHLGSAPVFIVAAIAGVLLGMTLESPKVLGALALLMSFGAASFSAIIFYAPVFDGLLVRTTNLDNYVMQRVLLMTLLIAITAVPGAIAGNWIGVNMSTRHEIAPPPEGLDEHREKSWWERRLERDPGDRAV